MLGFPVAPWRWDSVGTRHTTALAVQWSLAENGSPSVVIIRSDSGKVHGLLSTTMLSTQGSRPDMNRERSQESMARARTPSTPSAQPAIYAFQCDMRRVGDATASFDPCVGD